jgi:hypothetical protein
MFRELLIPLLDIAIPTNTDPENHPKRIEVFPVPLLSRDEIRIYGTVVYSIVGFHDAHQATWAQGNAVVPCHWEISHCHDFDEYDVLCYSLIPGF